MMVSFGKMICEKINAQNSYTKSAEYLTVLIQGLLDSKKVQELYIDKHDISATQSIRPSDAHIQKVVKDVLDKLYLLGQNPSDWKEASVNKIFEKGVQEYWDQWKRERNANYVLNELNHPSIDSCRLLEDWLDEGSNVSSFDIYRILFQNQNEYTVEIIISLIERGYIPDENNLHLLFVHDSLYTLKILEALAPYKRFTPTCLTFVLRYVKRKLNDTVKFLLDSKVVPDLYHLSFARKHLNRTCQRMLEKAYRDTRKDFDKSCLEDEFFFIESQPSVCSLPELDDIISDPNEESLSFLISHIGQGQKLTKGQFNSLVVKNKPFSLELLRVYFMNGYQLSNRQILRLFQNKNLYTPAIIKLSRMYGLENTNEITDNEMERKGEIDGELFKALSMPLPKFLKVDHKVLYNVIVEYVKRAPGLFELLIRSGVHPSLELLSTFCEVPKVKFFSQLLEKEPFFEANFLNCKLFEIAIQTSTGEIIQKLIDKGFTLTIENVNKAILHQPLNVSKKLVSQLKKDAKGKVKGSQSASVNRRLAVRNISLTNSDFFNDDFLSDPIALVLFDQNSGTARKLKELLDSGEIPSQIHVDLILKNPTLYSPELICILEESGVSIERI